MSTGVHVRADGVLNALDNMGDLVSGKDRDIMKYGRAIMWGETQRAFSQKVNPNTGRAWAPRKHEYPWPLLVHTGELFKSLSTSYGIRTRDKKLKLFGKVDDDRESLIRAGAVFFGRSKARSSRGTRLRGVSPTTGTVPPRPFFGFGRSARQRIRRYAERRLKRTFD